MAIPAWPDGVPYRPDMNSEQPVPRYLDPIKTDMEGGNQRQRARPGDNVGMVSYTVRMTKAQFATFDDWRKNTIGGGSGRFSVPVWMGAAFVTKVCQFSSVPKDKAVGTARVDVAIALRVYGT